MSHDSILLFLREEWSSQVLPACRWHDADRSSRLYGKVTLHFFVHALKDRLEEVKPSFGHGSHITASLGDDGYIHLESGNVDDDIARLAFFTVRHRLGWNCVDNTFFETPPPVF